MDGDGIEVTVVERIQVDGIRGRRSMRASYSQPMIAFLPATTYWGSTKWSAEPPTEEELDRYVRTGQLPDGDWET